MAVCGITAASAADPTGTRTSANAPGRKVPRDGGIILAHGKSKDEIETIMKDDPFCKNGLAEFRVIEFRASQRAADIPKRVDGP